MDCLWTQPFCFLYFIHLIIAKLSQFGHVIDGIIVIVCVRQKYGRKEKYVKL